jgi:hypothetical protein
MTTRADDTCRLCNSGGLSLVCWDYQKQRRRRPFYLCPDCGLISVPAEYHLSVADELSRYALHDNTLSNHGYVDFLSEIADVAAGVASGMARGRQSVNDPREQPVKLLDFGCGKEAALCRLIMRRGIGIDCRPYDPLYDGLRLTDAAVDKYDIVVACEVVEHLRDIEGELRLMRGLLYDGGAIILRTRLYDDAGVVVSAFQDWWYAHDPAHINFFSRKTLARVALITDKRIEETGHRDIFIFR